MEMVEQLNQNLEDETLDYLIVRIVEETLEQYEIKKLPQESRLAAYLEAYTKEKLLQLADDNNLDAKKSWKKAQIANYLNDGILDTLTERYLILGERKLKLLQQFSHDEFPAEEMSLEKADFYVSVYPVAVRMGLLYSLNKEDEVMITMPEEIKESLDDFLSNYDQERKQYRSQMNVWAQIDEVLKAGVHLYGALSASKVFDLWERHYPDAQRTEAETLEMLKYLYKILPLLALNNGYYFVEKSVIASPQFMDVEEVTDFYTQRSAKMDDDYYQPTSREIQYYAQHSFERRTLIYKKLKQFVSRISSDVDTAMEFIETNIVMGESLSYLLDDVGELELLEFKTQKQVEQFAQLYTQLHNDARLWENGGYTPREMFKQASAQSNTTEALSPADKKQVEKAKNNKQQIVHTQKIGRNDPCPCGSGKKYKKCCMRKSS